LVQLLCGGRGVMLFANCDRGLPICMDAAVLVARETFMSRVEKENADES
jgi:hypothetical protein